MDTPPPLASHCVGEFNVGVLDGVGVGILWLQVLRWFLYITFQDDINLLFCLPNPVVSFTKKDFILFVVTQMVSNGSYIYTIVKAFKCGDSMIGVLLICVNFYEIYFKFYKRFLIMFSGDQVDGPFCLFSIACSLSISYGGQLRIVGIVGISIEFLCACYHAIYFNFYPEGYKNVPGDYIYKGPGIICHAIVFPVILACFITIIVKDYSQWIPRPQSSLEYFFLITRILFGSGLFEVLKTLVMRIYHFFKPATVDPDEIDFWGFIRNINVTWIGIKSPLLAQQMRQHYLAQANREQ
ncbi:hypothetical protein BGZ76_001740 [Entomortierella beljakovae]|nr:hypothetical protein BGZ76_001740 [Entomortierella beljakovae]